MHTVHQTPGNPAPPRCRHVTRYWRASVRALPPPNVAVIDAWLAAHGLPPYGTP